MILSSSRHRRILTRALLCLLLVAAALLGWHAYLHNPHRGLPYRDSFSNGKADEWRAFGGAWDLVNGVMRNDSNERGAKLITGSPYWRNYSIEADVYLLGGNGDAGLVIRSGDEEEGVSSYSGYYAGIDRLNNTLVLGRAEHGWMEVTRDNPVPGGIRPFQWYHLKLLAYDCQIVAAVTTSPHEVPASLGINDQACLSSGRVGLRSYASGGVWHNVLVRPATRQDLVEMLRGMGGQGNSEPRNPIDEEPNFLRMQSPAEQQKENTRSKASMQSIESLRLSSFAKNATATIRGVVVLTSPLLFVQDSTGGVYIPQPHSPPLKLGDEVEATGEVHPGDFSSTLEHATVQVLWARTPIPPVSVTASQASTGKYDATFIEVHGRLAAKERGSGNTLILDLDQGPQSFRAIMNSGRSDYLFSRLKLNSSLRLRGICAVDSAFTHDLAPFVLLLRSNEDLEVLAGPPWWSTGHVIAIVAATLLLALIGLSLYQRVEHWRFRAIVEERERMAHELHDTLAQSFAGIGFQLQAIRNGLTDEMTTLYQQIELADTLVHHSHEEARRSIATLRTEDFESEDILSALSRRARRLVEGGSVQVVSEREGEQRPIPLRIADSLYRIGLEAVANALQHAQPTILTIRLVYSKNQACLQIEDNGDGFIPGNDLHGFGIRGMRRRAQSISTTLQIHSKPGEGTRIQVTAPLPPRTTLTTWPKLAWRYAREHWIDVRPSKQANSHSYRG